MHVISEYFVCADLKTSTYPQLQFGNILVIVFKQKKETYCTNVNNEIIWVYCRQEKRQNVVIKAIE